MDGLSIITASGGISGILSCVVIFAVKRIVDTSTRRVVEQLEAERDARVTIDNELWNAVNSHGHKGLDGNHARVTR